MSTDLELRALPADPDHPARGIWDQHLDPGSVVCHDMWKTLAMCPAMEVGQVSWLKAGLTGFDEKYVPLPILRTVELIGDGKILTPGLAKEITVAFNLPNRSIYGHVEYTHMRGVEAEQLAKYRRQSFPGQGSPRWWEHGFRQPNILVHRKGRGIAKGNVVKRFLEANIGCYLVHESV